MKNYFTFLLFFISIFSFSQNDNFRKGAIEKDIRNPSNTINTNTKQLIKRDTTQLKEKNISQYDTIPTIDKYIFKNIHNMSAVVDTTLHIQNFYSHNFLQEDTFGIQSFENDGMSYNVLDFSRWKHQFFSTIGFQARQFSLLSEDDIFYYNVPTPYSRIFFRTGIKQGQNLDAFITANTSKQTNLFVGYRGLRSLGGYINELSSVGNFRFGGSYDSKNSRYQLKTHIVVQDITQQENGGILEPDLYETKEGKRERLDVRLRDAQTLFKNTRLFADHSYQLNTSKDQKVWINHQVVYNYFSNLYTQPTVVSENIQTSYFGSYYSSNARDHLRNHSLSNTIDFSFDSKKLGQLSLFATWYQYNYYYNSIVNASNDRYIPHQIKENLLNIGGSYLLKAKSLDVLLYASQGILEKNYTQLQAQTRLSFTSDITLDLWYQFGSKLPDLTSRLFQSDFVHYNWYNDFSNEKIHEVAADLHTPLINLSGNFQLITDKIYFSNDSDNLDTNGMPLQLLVSPKQYQNTISYLALKAQKEFHWKKWSLDNTFEFQQVVQEDNILNVPTFITRNTLYYSDFLFKKALYIQGGVSAKYFSSYYMNGYHPLLGDYYVQNDTKIGDFPMVDVFLNMKIRTARVYLAVEQLNHLVGKSHHYSAPMYPYRDLTLRLGLTWNFFN